MGEEVKIYKALAELVPVAIVGKNKELGRQ